MLCLKIRIIEFTQFYRSIFHILWKKRTGGLAIIYKDGREKEKPSNAEIFHITDKLEKEWGKEHLKLENNVLIILDKDKKELRKLELNAEEITWIRNFFGI